LIIHNMYYDLVLTKFQDILKLGSV
jgi:hypothetical protein